MRGQFRLPPTRAHGLPGWPLSLQAGRSVRRWASTWRMGVACATTTGARFASRLDSERTTGASSCNATRDIAAGARTTARPGATTRAVTASAATPVGRDASAAPMAPPATTTRSAWWTPTAPSSAKAAPRSGLGSGAAGASAATPRRTSAARASSTGGRTSDPGIGGAAARGPPRSRQRRDERRELRGMRPPLPEGQAGVLPRQVQKAVPAALAEMRRHLRQPEEAALLQGKAHLQGGCAVGPQELRGVRKEVRGTIRHGRVLQRRLLRHQRQHVLPRRVQEPRP